VGEAGQLGLPGPHPVAVGAAGVGGDQQPGRRRVAVPALTVPPAAQGRGRERRGVTIAADRHPPGVGGQVVDAIRHRLGGPLLGEVVGTHPHRLPRPVPLTPADGVLAEHLLLLGVDADHRLPVGGELLDPVVDVAKLRVAVRMPRPSVVRQCPAGRIPRPSAARPRYRRPPDAPAGSTPPPGSASTWSSSATGTADHRAGPARPAPATPGPGPGHDPATACGPRPPPAPARDPGHRRPAHGHRGPRSTRPPLPPAPSDECRRSPPPAPRPPTPAAVAARPTAAATGRTPPQASPRSPPSYQDLTPQPPDQINE